LNMTINFPHNDNLYHYMELYCSAKPFILGDSGKWIVIKKDSSLG